MMQHYSTLFDINYLSRGLALLHSIKKESKQPFILFVLCLDEKTLEFFEKNEHLNVRLIKTIDIENKYPILKTCKEARKHFEYYFTLKPFLSLYILETFPDVKQITTVDSDIFFFDDPFKIIDFYKDYSILITPHAFPDKIKHFEINGKYNAGFQSLKNDEYGLKCLRIWAKNCAEWCFDYYDKDNDRYADQKYIDRWMTENEKIASIELIGSGVSTWNVENYKITYKNDKPFIENTPVIYYHYHGLRKLNNYFFAHCLNTYSVDDKKNSLKIYKFYARHLNLFEKQTNFFSNNITRLNVKKSNLFATLLNTNGVYFFSPLISFEINLMKIHFKLSKIKMQLKKTVGLNK
jgi:hypothetical protein